MHADSEAGGRTGPALAPGRPAESLLLERVGSDDERTRMPPEGKPLSAEQVALLKAWVEQGAKAPKDEQPEADQRKAIEDELQRFTLRVTRRTVPIIFSMMLVQASKRRNSAEDRACSL